MKKNFKMLAALAVAVAATSCSNDDLMTGLENNGAQNKGAIGVNTFIANGTRGMAYDNVEDFRNDEGDFDLYAWEKLANDAGYQTEAFMDGVKFIVDGNGWDYEDKGKVRFWQELGEGSTVDFYAVSPAELENNQIGSDEQKIYFSVAGESANQVDLMYAKNTGISAEGEATDGDDAKKNGVKLDFHHALSQIVFKAKVHQDYVEYVKAEVEKVEIVNLYGTGIFDFANATNGDGTQTYESWTYQDMDGNELSAEASYEAEFTDPVTVNADYTSEDIQQLTDKTTALLLLPQNITGAEIEDNKEEPEAGTYFAVTCKVWYQRTTTDGDGNETTENILIVGDKDETSGEEKSITLYYPLTTSWYEGWKYTYTFVFSANTADPITIDETSTVDAWWPGEYDDNNTDVPESTPGEMTPPDWESTPVTFVDRTENEEFSWGLPQAVKDNADFGVEEGATGTQDNPWLIDEVEELLVLAYKTGRVMGQMQINVNYGWTWNSEGTYYKQTNDLDLTTDAAKALLKEMYGSETTWMTIGSSMCFQANYDGGNNSIKVNFTDFVKLDEETMTESAIGMITTDYGGLFHQVGHIVGENKETVTNLTVAGEIELDENSSVEHLGAIAGRSWYAGTITECTSSVDFKYTWDEEAGETAQKVAVGGIVGQAESKEDIGNCTFTGKINDEADSDKLIGAING